MVMEETPDFIRGHHLELLATASSQLEETESKVFKVLLTKVAQVFREHQQVKQEPPITPTRFEHTPSTTAQAQLDAAFAAASS
eukprot:5810113-Karenia_brevis.AAC.1